MGREDFTNEEREMIDKIRQSSSNYKVPKELEAENIVNMLNAKGNNMEYVKYDNNRGKKPYKKFIPIIALGAAVAVAMIAVFAIPHRNAYQRVIPSLGINQPAMTLAYAADYKEIRDVLNAANMIRGNNGSYVDGGEWIEDFAPNGSEKGDVAQADGAMAEDAEASTNPSDSENDSDKDYSDTNEQVEGVHEADVVKTDGRYIYSTNGLENGIKIVDTKTEKLVATISISDWDEENLSSDFEMYYSDDKLIIVATKYSDYYSMQYGYEDETCVAYVFDVSDRSNPKLDGSSSISGYYVNSRLVGDTLYLFSKYAIYDYESNDCVPCANGKSVDANDVCYLTYIDSCNYLNVASINIKDPGNIVDNMSFLGEYNDLYVSENSIYVATYGDEYFYDKDITQIIKINYYDGLLEGVATVNVEGYVKNQFNFDEKDGNLRLVADVMDYNTWQDTSSVYVLDEGLNLIGRLDGVSPGEQVKSTRFMGDMCYFVTFENTDPLFAVDLSNPSAPTLIGELKITGFSDYLHPWSDNLLLGIGYEIDPDSPLDTIGIKLTMFDISDPTNIKVKDSTVIKDYTEGYFGNNHKSVMIDPEKGLIGFVAKGSEFLRKDKYYYEEDYDYDYDGDDVILYEPEEIKNVINDALDDVLKGLAAPEDETAAPIDEPAIGGDYYEYDVYKDVYEYLVINYSEDKGFSVSKTGLDADIEYDANAYTLTNTGDIRGLYIGEKLYVVIPDSKVNVYDLKTLAKTSEISIK